MKQNSSEQNSSEQETIDKKISEMKQNSLKQNSLDYEEVNLSVKKTETKKIVSNNKNKKHKSAKKIKEIISKTSTMPKTVVTEQAIKEPEKELESTENPEPTIPAKKPSFSIQFID